MDGFEFGSIKFDKLKATNCLAHYRDPLLFLVFAYLLIYYHHASDSSPKPGPMTLVLHRILKKDAIE
jgi:hypothetical protein